MDLIYLDNNATTRPASPVVAAMTEALELLWGNPSSVHRFGQMVRQRVELARSAVAKLINCRERELIFTSGGTEANNLALRGLLEPVARRGEAAVLMTTKVEHSAVREPAETLAEHGTQVVYLPTDLDGRIDCSALEAALDEHREAVMALISIQWANNETGVIQPVEQVAELVQAQRTAHRTRVLLHVDATQAAGKLPVDVKACAVDLLTLAAHKFHGPKGIGALHVRRGVRLRPQQRGGPQERDQRGGTENVPGILGMGVAAELAARFLSDVPHIEQLQALRDLFERGLLAAVDGSEINGARLSGTPRLWNTTNIGFPRLEAEAILLGLSERGVCASAGAACSSGSLDPSPVLLAMGVPPPLAHGSVRFSISRDTTKKEIDAALDIVPQVVHKLSRTLPAPA